MQVNPGFLSKGHQKFSSAMIMRQASAKWVIHIKYLSIFRDEHLMIMASFSGVWGSEAELWIIPEGC